MPHTTTSDRIESERIEAKQTNTDSTHVSVSNVGRNSNDHERSSYEPSPPSTDSLAAKLPGNRATENTEGPKHDLAKYSVSVCADFPEFCESSNLVYRQYVRQGLMNPTNSGLRLSPVDRLPTTTTILVKDGERTVGTLSTVLGQARELPFFELFAEYVKDLDLKRTLVAESTKFACEEVGEKQNPYIARQLIRWTFHLCAHRGVKYLFSVVNPRHVGFWKRNVAFEIVSDAVDCPHVQDHPGVLLRLDVAAIAAGDKPVNHAARRLLLENPVAQPFYLNSYRPSDEDMSLIDHWENEVFLLDSEQKCDLDKPDILSPRCFSLRSALKNVRAMAIAAASQKDVSLKFTIDDEVPDHIVADVKRFSLLLSNLLGKILIQCEEHANVDLKCSVFSRFGAEVKIEFLLRASGLQSFPEIDPFLRLKTRVPGSFFQSAASAHEQTMRSRFPLVELLGGELWVARAEPDSIAIRFRLETAEVNGVLEEPKVSRTTLQAPGEKISGMEVEAEDLIEYVNILFDRYQSLRLE